MIYTKRELQSVRPSEHTEGMRHTVKERPVPCWQNGVTMQCYVMTENDLNLWADLQVHYQISCSINYANIIYNKIKSLATVSINKKPPQINLYKSV